MAARQNVVATWEQFDIPTELGLRSQQAQQRLLQQVIVAPAPFYELRERALNQLVLLEGQRIYGILMQFMYTGDLPVFQNEAGQLAHLQINGERFFPYIPLSVCKPLALSVVTEYTQLLQSVLERVLPRNHLDLAKQTQAKQQEGQTGIHF
jgi:hypothetical protein